MCRSLFYIFLKKSLLLMFIQDLPIRHELITKDQKMKKLCLLDTNIISDTLKRNQSIHDSVFDKLNHEFDFCIPLLTLAELRYSPDLLEGFCKLTDIFIFHILKPSKQILADEIANYPSEIAKEEIILMTIDPKNSIHKSEIDNYLRSEKFRENSDLLKNDQILAIKNIEQTVISERKNNEDNFVSRYIWSQLAMKYSDFMKSIIKENDFLGLNTLKSLYLQAHFIYYKYIQKGQKEKLSDTFDILIISNLPYVDLFLTERNNAGLLRELKRKLSLLKKLEIETMRDLRNVNLF